MNEAYVTGQLVRALREARAGHVYKFNDRITSGIPDLAVTNPHGTAWLEVKLTRCPRTTLSEVRVGQLVELEALERAGGRVWYVIFSKAGDAPVTIKPTEIAITAPQGNEPRTVYTLKPPRSRPRAELVALIREGRYDEI